MTQIIACQPGPNNRCAPSANSPSGRALKDRGLGTTTAEMLSTVLMPSRDAIASHVRTSKLEGWAPQPGKTNLDTVSQTLLLSRWPHAGSGSAWKPQCCTLAFQIVRRIAVKLAPYQWYICPISGIIGDVATMSRNYGHPDDICCLEATFLTNLTGGH